MRLTRKHWSLVLLSVTGVLVLALMYARWRQADQRGMQSAASGTPQPVPSAVYADPAVCSSCHDEIARTYSLTGMGRSFSRVRPDAGKLASGEGARLYHKASDRHYSVAERGACRLVVRLTGAQRSLISSPGVTDQKPNPRCRVQDSDSHD